MRGCSRLNSSAAPSGQSSVPDQLRIRLAPSSHANVVPRDDPFHGCHCHVKASFRMRRRNEIQRALKDDTKKCLDLLDQVVHLEAYAGTTAGTDLVAPKRVTADISVIVSAETLWIDVSVVDPGCHHYIQRYHSSDVPDAAAQAMETTKWNHNSAVKDPSHLRPSSLSCSRPQED